MLTKSFENPISQATEVQLCEALLLMLRPQAFPVFGAASYGEGFGLPLIEAAQHKLPIIARDIPVFREVAEDHAYYFKADDAGELAVAIEQWLKLFEAQQHPQAVRMPWNTWAQSANAVLAQILPRHVGQTTGQSITLDSKGASCSR